MEENLLNLSPLEKAEMNALPTSEQTRISLEGMTPQIKKKGKKKRREYPTEETCLLCPYDTPVSYTEPQLSRGHLIEPPENRSNAPSSISGKKPTFDARESEGEYIKRKKKRKSFKLKSKMKRSYSKESLPELEVSPSRENLARVAEVSLVSELEEEVYWCQVARTALILPFTWKTGTDIRRTVVEWMEKLKERTVCDMSGVTVPLWQPKERLPIEVRDFTPQFRQVVGWKDRDRGYTNQTWTCQRLTVHECVINSLLSGAQLYTIQEEKVVAYDADIEAIDLLVYPMGSAILVFHINWIPPRTKEKFSLDDMRTVVFASKYRQKIQQLCLGWHFSCQEPILESARDRHIKSIGTGLFNARYIPENTIALAALGNWLLHLVGEDPSSPPALLDYTRHAHHHSTVVINKEPMSDVLQEYLFHLRRAFGQQNRPPPDPASSLGSVLVPRMNRYIGVSREGTVCLSWPLSSEESNVDFELAKWHNKFQGVYLILALHVHGERSVLFELGDMAAAEAENLKLVAAETNFEEMKVSRQRLRELASLMVRYTLSMSSNDCGGRSEYSEFFTTIRQVYGIPELRAELSSELKDVLAVVESNYLEEERRQRDLVDMERRRNREREFLEKTKKDMQDSQFSLMVGFLSSFTLPFVVVGGVYGMNLKNLPTDVDFWLLIGLTFLSSVLLFAFMFIWRMWAKRQPSK